MQENKEKVQSIWRIVRTIIELVIGAIVGAGVEAHTSVIHSITNL